MSHRNRLIECLIVAACCALATASSAQVQSRSCDGAFSSWGYLINCDENIHLHVYINNNSWILSEMYIIDWWLSTPDGRNFTGTTWVTVPAGERGRSEWTPGTPLDVTGTWYWGVDVWDQSGNYCFYESTSEYWSVFLVTPAPPTGVIASDGTYCDKVRITWNSVSAADYYKLYRDGNQIGSNISGTSYNDTSASPGTTYSYKVKACNYCGCSGYSSWNSGYRESVVSAPSGVDATDGTYCDKVRITWNSVSGANYYKLYRNGSQIGGNISGTSYNDTSASPGTTYSYKLKANGDCGDSGYSNSNSGYRESGVSAPSGVDATDGTYCDKVRITWNSVSGANYYKLYRNGNQIGGNISGTSYNDTSASPGTAYSYKLKANGDCGDSGYGSSNSGYRGSAPSTPPGGVSASDGTHCDKVRITWNSVSGASYYELYRDGSQIGGNISGTSYNDTSASPGTTYSYKLKAHNDCGSSAYSSSNSGYRGSAPSTPPGGVSASDGTYCDKVSITWNSVSGASYYELYRDGSQIGGNISGTSYDDTSASPGTTYSYKLKAHNNCGSSEYSSPDSGNTKTQSTAPTGASASPMGICSGGSSILTEVGGSLGAGASWQWYSGSCGGTYVGSGSPITVSPGSETTYYVRAEGDCNMTSCASVTVTVVSTVTWYVDNDHDGFGDEHATGIESCDPPSPASDYVTNNKDCDDNDPAINPDAVEVCDGVDNNCDGEIDEGFPKSDWYEDKDEDTYGNKDASPVNACSPPDDGIKYVDNNTDCDDNDASVNPGAADKCDDAKDNNCDGRINEGCPVCPDGDRDNDGVCDSQDACPDDPEKTDPGLCGCGAPEPTEDKNENGVIDVGDCIVPILHPVNLLIVGNGAATKDPDKSLYEVGEVVTLTAVPDACWQFDKWEGDDVSGLQNPVQVTVGENGVSATVNFTEDANGCGCGLCAAGSGGVLPFMIFGMFLMKNQVRRRRWRRVS